MPWIVAIIAGLLIGALLVSSRTARTGLIAVAGLIVVLAAALIFYEKTAEIAAHSAIAPEEVELRDARMEPRGGLFYLVVAVKNLSEEHAIETLTIRITAHDCPTEALDDTCEAVGENDLSARLPVPPGQVRGIDQLSPIANLPDVRNLVWSFEVVDVRAET